MEDTSCPDFFIVELEALEPTPQTPINKGKQKSKNLMSTDLHTEIIALSYISMNSFA